MFGVPKKHFAIGYVHNENLPLGNIALQYVIQNNCRKVWWCVSDEFLHFLKIKKKICRIHQNYLVALKETYQFYRMTLTKNQCIKN